MKITALEIENVKRIKAVRMEPAANGLTIIGGKNGQGKTSVLDAIAYAFGGERFRPSSLRREDAVGDAYIRVETDDGYVVERRGKNAELRITDPSGLKGGQKILDDLVGKYAINLPKFMAAPDTEKAKMLLDVIGVGGELARLEREEKSKYNERLQLGRIAEQKAKAAEEMPEYAGVPDEPASISELMRRHQAVLERNAENMRLREAERQIASECRLLEERLADVQAKLSDAQKRHAAAQRSTADLRDESTAEIEAQIADFEETNRKVAANADKRRVRAEAEDLQAAYKGLTDDIEGIRAERMRLLEGANLPYPGLAVEDGVLKLGGKAWDCMSGAQQLTVACAISLAMNPRCRLVLMDKLEQFDADTLALFDAWLKTHDIQAITTRVSTGGECTLIIEDGEVKRAEAPKDAPQNTRAGDLPDEY